MFEKDRDDKPQPQCGIYKITNLINDKCYIGQSINIQKRWNAHKRCYNIESYHEYNKVLYKAFRKYGIENFDFEIVEECKPDELNEREIYWITYYNSFKNGYNATPGGDSPVKIDIEKLYKLWDEGKTVKELREFFHVNKATIFHHLSSYKNYSIEEARRRGALKGVKKIIQYSLDGVPVGEWDSCKQIYRETGINRESVMKCLQGKYYKAGGYRWAYKGELLNDSSKNNLVKNEITKLNWSKVHQIKEQLKEGTPKTKIADDFSVSISTIERINGGRSWKEENWNYPIYDFRKKKSNN